MKNVRIRVKFVEKDVELRVGLRIKNDWEIDPFMEALKEMVRNGPKKKKE